MMRSSWIFLVFGLSACTVGPDYRQPDIVMPKVWQEGVKDAAAVDYQPQWWKTFNDPLLTQLITESASTSLDLEKAAARIREARAQQSMANSAILPSITARNNVSRRSNNLSSSAGSSNLPAGAGGGFGFGNQVINIFQTGFDAQWELDIFGGVRRSMEAAEASLSAAQEDKKVILVSLQGEIARLYVQLRANQQLLAVTRESLQSQQDTLLLTQIRVQAGLAAELEVAQQQAQVADTQALLPDYETVIKQSIHGLSILLGREPGALQARLQAPKALPVATAAINNLPSELLRRRPDIRRNERQLAAANAQVGVAVAQLYPKFNLAAFLGIQNTKITDFSPVGKSWSAAASISMPVFNWENLQANIRGKKAQRDELLVNYRASILTAMQEVEDALVACHQEGLRKQALQEAITANQLALDLAQERYQKGLTAFLEVLDSQRNLLQAKSNTIESQARISRHLISLYKALGGGWESFEIHSSVSERR